MNPRLRDTLCGVLLLPALACVGIGGTAFFWPDTGISGTMGRILDSLAPHLLVTGLVLGLLLAVLGKGRWIKSMACALVLAALGAAAPMILRHQAVAVPLEPDAEPQLTVLWFNIYADNPTPPDRLAAALLASGADLLVLGEAAPVLPALPALKAAYPHQLGCEEGPKTCSTLVLSRLPFAAGSAHMIKTSRTGRMASFRLEKPQGGALDLVAVHMPKPWFYGFYDVDLWHLLDQSRRSDAPLVVLGDFNAASWSRPMARIFRETGLAPLHRAPATWPAAAGRFGVPIDQMLLRGGVALGALAPWGQGLGSNHLGLLATLGWSAATD